MAESHLASLICVVMLSVQETQRSVVAVGLVHGDTQSLTADEQILNISYIFALQEFMCCNCPLLYYVGIFHVVALNSRN